MTFDLEAYRKARQEALGGAREPGMGKTQRSGYWPESEASKTARRLRERLCDKFDRKNAKWSITIVLTDKELENLEKIAESHRLNQYPAIVRDLISKAAKDV
jgi:hypothetical protein